MGGNTRVPSGVTEFRRNFTEFFSGIKLRSSVLFMEFRRVRLYGILYSAEFRIPAEFHIYTEFRIFTVSVYRITQFLSTILGQLI